MNDVIPTTTVQRAAAQRSLGAILHERFGHRSFRPNQEDVCCAVTSGCDGLLVMPTGSGKSLCYQLPGIAREGTTLVISPLIALMNDQTTKLCEKGFRAEQIHSGRSREQSRAVCRAYLDGALDFLMIAPERLAVPGFPEMLARRTPALIAVDEAHCISHWGHDFRPDYRLLGARLPLLRPAPILALTATATVRVQDDILTQLGIPGARKFIHGFRRDNIAIEVMERPRAERIDLALATLCNRERRPAVVYVPSRKMAENVAEKLAAVNLRAAPYHAGLEPHIRSKTQEAFQSGELDIVVATIAFGMGIDKSDIRTVIHLALPGTLEGYYQEIGRAGRDGHPSRALLYYSWGDRKIHENFVERDYPGTPVLESLLDRVPKGGIDRTALLAHSELDMEVAESALGKLWSHGGVSVDADDAVWPGKAGWQKSYEAIRDFRIAQLDEVVGFAKGADCRMLRLVRHFGELRDSKPCGLCDVCQPQECVGRQFRAPTSAEQLLAEQLFDSLQDWDGRAVGAVLKELFPRGGMERSEFERLLGWLERSGAVSLSDDEFEKDGKSIRYRRVSIGPLGRAGLRDKSCQVEDGGEVTTKRIEPKRRKGMGVADSGKKPAKTAAPIKTVIPVRPAKPAKSADTGKAARPVRRAKAESTTVIVDAAIEKRLRQWRQGVAKRRRVPAFLILKDKTLCAIASARPGTVSELSEIQGVGAKFVAKYWAEVLAVVKG